MTRGTAWVVALGIALAVAGCSPSPEKAGDECDPDGDACPSGLVCAAGGEADNTCQVPAGASCVGAESYCVSGNACVGDGKGGATCGVAEAGACDPAATKCGGNLVCAEVETGDHACFAPVLITGDVFDSLSQAAIAGAHVIALDPQSTAITDVAISDPEGKYTLEVPAVRTATGEPVAPFTQSSFTLRSSAAGYQTFPGGIRAALPIDATAEKTALGYVIASPLTRIALVALPEEEQGRVAISGKVLADEDAGGVLVVAESDAGAASTISDASGNYTIFNVADGTYKVRGYAAGLQLESKDATVAGAAVTGVDLAQSDAALGSISGNLQIVNAAGGSATSVVLVVKSTFSDTFVRGEVPRGLRTPLSGTPDVTGDFKIENVPAGEYIVLAAFENDELVLDPDPNISGTQIVSVTMDAPGEAVALSSSFKVTQALTMVGPGAEDAEGVAGTPVFTWKDDSSEDFYSVVVYDSFGNLVWENPDVAAVSGGGDASVPYEGPALEPGMYYQWRATAWRSPGGTPGPIAKTEDLRGVFFLQPTE